MELKKYWDQAIHLEDYIELTKQRINHPKDAHEAEYKQYYELGLQRMERTLKTLKKDEVQSALLESKNFEGKILIISEPWCGDASTTVPAVYNFFKDHNEVRIFLRDADTTLIDQFLTNGTQSIPIVLLLDENFNAINHWGPRPEYGRMLLKKFKENPEAYPREEFYNDLQVYYAKNKGKDAIKEILALI